MRTIKNFTAYLLLFSVCSFISSGCSRNNYELSDFNKIKKIDAHVHDNSESNTFSEVASENGFKILSINVDYPDFPNVEFQQNVAKLHLKDYRNVFAYASTFYLNGWDETGWADKIINHLDSTFKDGATAVKFWKNIGMVFRDKSGKYIMIDDEKLDPVFNYLTSKNIPVVVHCGEPRDCWLAVEKMMSNDMKEYFSKHPQYHMYLHPDMPSYLDQINARDRMLAKHPDMKFMGAHIGSLEWSVDEAARFLDKYPNAKVDLAARMDYLQLQSQKDWDKVYHFFCKYKERILYGTDLIIGPKDDTTVFKQVTRDKWLSDWKYLATDLTMSVNSVKGEFKGLALPKEVINKIYYSNAEKLFYSAWK
ncbi:MAG: amidohydrolase [Ignavibacteriales bacterium]|nr:MAG: amidohydrolase [Ignavibacteriales bacterium]